MCNKKFYCGQSVYYVPAHAKKDRLQWELGRIKRISEDGKYAFVWYHEGDTAARTKLDDLVPC